MTFYKVSLSSSSLKGVTSLREALDGIDVDQTTNPVAVNSPPPTPDNLGESEGNSMDMSMDAGQPPLPAFMPSSDDIDNSGSHPPSPSSDVQGTTKMSNDAPPPVPTMKAKVKKNTKKIDKKAVPKSKVRNTKTP